MKRNLVWGAAVIIILSLVIGLVSWQRTVQSRKSSTASSSATQGKNPSALSAQAAQEAKVAAELGIFTPALPYAPSNKPRTASAPIGKDGLWAAAASKKTGDVLLEQRRSKSDVAPGFAPLNHKARASKKIAKRTDTQLVDRIVRVEGRRYPAVRVLQEIAWNPDKQEAELVKTTEMVADQIMVNLAPGVTVEQLSKETGIPFSLRKRISGTGTAVLAFDVAAPDTVDQVYAAVKTAAAQNPKLLNYSEPDYIVRALAEPNDPKYTDGSLWGMHNTGQNEGTDDADVDAPEGWGTRTSAIANITQSRATNTAYGFGSNELIIAVVDTGVRYTHEDIAANMWKNPGEQGLDSSSNDKATNGIDDDGNGVVDDVYGVNAYADSGDPMDDHYHGTHCAGTIAGVGNNSLGVAGVAWTAKIMACKFLDSDGSGSNSDSSEALWYAWETGADVISCSFGGGTESSEVTNQMMAAGKNGAIVVVAAGNDSKDLEETATYPAAAQLENIVTVCASTRLDEKSSFSNYNYGWSNVFAPGSAITSLGADSDTEYRELSGTSMATPLTAGIVALLRAQFPTETYGQIINRLYRGVDTKSEFNGKCQTGGRVNLQKALTTTINTPFNDDFASASAMLGSAPHSLRTTNFSATAESGEPSIGGVTANKTVWYKWTAPSTASYILSTKGSSYSKVTLASGSDPDTYGWETLDTVLGVYTGSAVNSLTLIQENNDYNDAGTTKLWSRLTFAATSGTTYYFAVGTNPSATVQEGMIILSISEPPANDNFAAATEITSIPFSSDKSNVNALRETDEPKLTRFNVAGKGATEEIQDTLDTNYPDKDGTIDDGGASVWWKWTPSTSGTYTVSTLGSSIDTMLGIYTGTAVNALTLVAENDDMGVVRMGNEYIYLTFSRLSYNFTAGTTYYFQVDGFQGKEGDVTLSISQPPANDDIVNATVVSGNKWSTAVNNVGASFEDAEPLHAGEYGGVSVWYKWVAPSTQDYQLTLPVSTITTALAVYTSPTPSAPVVSTLVEVASNCTPIMGSNVRLSPTAGQTYFIAVDGRDGKQRSDMQLDLSPTPGALLNDRFVDRTRLYGTSASVGSTTSGASYETDEPDFYGSTSQRSVWWTWTAPASGSVSLTTQSSAYNAALGVYTGTAVNALTEVAKNKPPAGQESSGYGTVTFSATRGTTYQFGVFGQASYCGNVMLNLSMTLTNQLPKVETAALSASTVFSDQSVTVSSFTTSDTENDTVTVAYQWQSSSDRFTWSDASGLTTSTLPAADTNAELFWRCTLTPSDATGDGNPFYTEPVAIQRRPIQIGKHNQAFSFNADLPIEGAIAPAKRTVIINEFSKTDSASASDTGASNGEWIELLTLQDVNLANYELGNVFASIRFLDVALWQNVPKGTLIVVYNPTDKSAIVPADDLDASDGRIVVSGQDATYFDDGNGSAPAFPKLSGSGYVGSDDAGTGARICINRAFVGTVDDISYHNIAHLGGEAQYYRNPHLTTTLPVRKTYRYIRDTEDACETSTAWELGNADASFATPGQPNNSIQSDWINKLRAPAPQYRFASGSNTPAGLTIDATTGLISGTINEPAGGLFRVIVERYATGSTTQTQTFDLLVATADRVYTIGSGQTFNQQGNLDLGTATLINGGTITDNGYSLQQKQSYATWAAATGATGGATATADRLGVTNQIAFALNIDPDTATPAMLPQLGTTTVDSSTYLTLKFRKQKSPNRLTYTVENSGNLTAWNPGDPASPTQLGSATSIDFGTEEVTYKDSVPLTAGVKRFMRIKVADNLVAPSTPANPVAAVGVGQVTVTWDAVSGADSYTVKRSTVSGGPYTAIVTGWTGTSYNDTTTATGTTYYYIVVAVSVDDGESLAGTEKTVTTPASWVPDAPTGLAATPDAAKVALSWSSVTNATSYTVKRSTTSGSGYTDLATGLTSTSYNDTTGTAGTLYYYVVVAVNAGGNSANSSEVSSAIGITRTWDGGGSDSLWATANNWNTDNDAPRAQDSVTFPADTGKYSPSVSAAASITDITFTGGNSYTLGGSGPLTLKGNIDKSGSTVVQTINTPLVLSGQSATFTNKPSTNSNLVLGGGITGTGNVRALSTNDSCVVRISGSTSWTGNLTIGNFTDLGAVRFDGTGLPSGTIFFEPKSSWGNNLTFGSGSTQTFTIANPITFSAGSSDDAGNLGINISTSAAATISGNITSADTAKTPALVQFAFGTSSSLTLTGTNNFTGIPTFRLNDNGAASSTKTFRFGANALTGVSTCLIQTVSGDASNRGTLKIRATTDGQSVTQNFQFGGQSLTTGLHTASVGGDHASGTVTFSGNMNLDQTHWNNSGNWADFAADNAGAVTVISGLINDGSNTQPVTISGSGTVRFTRAAGNTYDGTTTVNGNATLLVENTSNSATGTGAVTVSSGATLGGTGTIAGAVTVADGGKLTANLSTAAASHDKLDITGALSFSGASTLTITKSGTPGTGTYTLLTAVGGITGTLPTLSLPASWSATLQLNGNDLELVVTAAP
jgi:subtilisin family serine protease